MNDVIGPVVLPLVGAAVGLMIRRWPVAQRWFCFSVMVLTLLAALGLWQRVASAEMPRVLALGNWSAPFGIVLVADSLGAFMTVMSALVMMAGMGYALGCRDKCVRAPTFYPLFLTLAAGLHGGILTGDLFNLFVFTELVVISGAALTALSDDENGVEASYKYFYISIVAGVLLLLSAAGLYATHGTLNLADLAGRITQDGMRGLTGIAMVCLAAFCFVKSAVVPFHFWQPDFHTAAPTPVHAVLSSVVVKLGIVWLMRMTTLLAPAAAAWQALLVVLGVAGVFFGGLGAVGTYDAKRMLAYSTMGQLGFILVAIGWGTATALTAAVVYAFHHSLAKAAMLMLAGSVASRAPIKSARWEVVAGVGRTMPGAGVLFLLGGMALAGIPLTNGFVSKWMVFRSGMDAGDVITVLVLAGGSVLSLVYVGRAFQQIWWEVPPADTPRKTEGDQLWAPAALIAMCVVFGVYARPVTDAATRVVHGMRDMGSYQAAVLGQR
ncbi:MAG: proton-conducting transporter membrane subunit [Verrucomicrobiae bacterium]|nr:proton-conducting transporter membrane subunit [Verrucomicrobiae bacterium]